MERRDFERVVECLSLAKDKTGNLLAMKNITMSDANQTFSHNFMSDPGFTDLRSVSKVPLCMAVGAAIESGYRVWGEPLTSDTCIFPLLEPFAKGLAPQQIAALRKVRLRHLLSNTIGHAQGFLFRKDIGDRKMDSLLEYIVETPIEYEPGSHFSYSNVGPYLVSVLVQSQFGISLSDWVKELIFGPIGIESFIWNKYGDYVAGCTGLLLESGDLHRIGQVLLNDGAWRGKQVVPKEWVNQMRSPIVRSPEKYEPHRALPKFSYGFSLWVTETGNYYCDGTDGQYLIVAPAQGVVISTTGSQADMKPITECMRGVL
jgi:CubicO group peptidase (beta-lactamase class C family)